jgi:hypothetical protein
MKRVIVLNIGLVAAISLLIITGYITNIFFGGFAIPVWVLTGLTVYGIACIFFNDLEKAKWLSNHMTRFGMIGTLFGMINGLSSLEFTTTDVANMATELAHHTAYAFYSTLFGVLGNIWINYNLTLVKE